MENLAMTDNCVPNASTSTDDKAIASRSQQNSSSKASYTKSNPASPILHSESSMTLGDTKSSGFSLDDARSQTSSVDTSTTEKEDEKPTVVAGKGPRRWRGFTVTQSTVSNGEHAGSMEDEEQEDGDDDSTSGGTMNKRWTEQEYSGVVSSSKKDEVGKQGREDLADQIQGLLVHDPASVDDEDPDSEDDRASRKSHRSTVSSLHSYVSSATNYDLLLARLGAQQHIQEQRPPASEHQVMDTPQSQTEPSKDAANEEEETDWGDYHYHYFFQAFIIIIIIAQSLLSLLHQNSGPAWSPTLTGRQGLNQQPSRVTSRELASLQHSVERSGSSWQNQKTATWKANTSPYLMRSPYTKRQLFVIWLEPLQTTNIFSPKLDKKLCLISLKHILCMIQTSDIATAFCTLQDLFCWMYAGKYVSERQGKKHYWLNPLFFVIDARGRSILCLGAIDAALWITRALYTPSRLAITATVSASMAPWWSFTSYSQTYRVARNTVVTIRYQLADLSLWLQIPSWSCFAHLRRPFDWGHWCLTPDYPGANEKESIQHPESWVRRPLTIFKEQHACRL